MGNLLPGIWGVRWSEFNFPMGYTMEVQWDNCNEFDTHPAFGLPTKTYQVDFYTH